MPMAPLPFKIKHDATATLSDQIAGSLLAAIRSGYYGPGDRLPNIVQMAATLGVSDRIVRVAIKQLTDKGELLARRKHGIRVVATGEKAWRKHVLFIQFGESPVYYRRHHRVEDILTADNIRVTPVRFGFSGYELNLQKVQTILDTQPVDLIILAGGGDDLVTAVERFRVPIVTVGGMFRSRRGLAHVEFDFYCADTLADYARTCQARQLTVLSCLLPHLKELPAACAARGLACEIIHRQPAVQTAQEVEHTGLALMRELLQRPRPPDFVYVTDDFLARGCLIALLEARVQVPEQLQFALLANRDNLPAFSRELTRLEIDPVADAEIIGDLVKTALQTGRREKTARVITPTLIQGATTCPRATADHANSR